MTVIFSNLILPVLPAWHGSLSVTNEVPIFRDEAAKEFFLYYVDDSV